MKELRTGFSTSACAAAAAAAGLRTLILKERLSTIQIDLPSMQQVLFPLERCEIREDGVLCGVIKDAGDDPDVTHGLEIQALVSRHETPGIELCGGKGVGIVTLPGLPVPVGQAAINPGSRRLILRIVEAELSRYAEQEKGGFRITIIVPKGEQVAGKTMNPTLGIQDGISILGTDGLVRPYSVPAFRASLHYALKVAHENGYQRVGLATGKRSRKYLMQDLDDAPGYGVVDVGDELDYPITQAQRLGFRHIMIGGMIGKLSKLAQGKFQTHVKEGGVDFDFLSDVAAHAGAPAGLCERIRTARTAHQVQVWLKHVGIAVEPRLAALAAGHVFTHVKEALDVGMIIFSLDGVVLGRAVKEVRHGS
jgi:cobalt-precorrin-5B (C1)-methyltransferase